MVSEKARFKMMSGVPVFKLSWWWSEKQQHSTSAVEVQRLSGSF